MSAPMTQPVESQTDEEIIHWCYLDKPNLALCGADVTEERWVGEEEPVNCEPCLIADAEIEGRL